MAAIRLLLLTKGRSFHSFSWLACSFFNLYPQSCRRITIKCIETKDIYEIVDNPVKRYICDRLRNNLVLYGNLVKTPDSEFHILIDITPDPTAQIRIIKRWKKKLRLERFRVFKITLSSSLA